MGAGGGVLRRRADRAAAAGACRPGARGPGPGPRPRLRSSRRDRRSAVSGVRVAAGGPRRILRTVFGTLAGVRGFADPKAIKLPNGNSVFEQPYPLTPDGFLRPWEFDSSTYNPCTVPVDNGWDSRHTAWANGQMNGFIGATSGTPNY